MAKDTAEYFQLNTTTQFWLIHYFNILQQNIINVCSSFFDNAFWLSYVHVQLLILQFYSTCNRLYVFSTSTESRNRFCIYHKDILFHRDECSDVVSVSLNIWISFHILLLDKKRISVKNGIYDLLLIHVSVKVCCKHNIVYSASSFQCPLFCHSYLCSGQL